MDLFHFSEDIETELLFVGKGHGTKCLNSIGNVAAFHVHDFSDNFLFPCATSRDGTVHSGNDEDGKDAESSASPSNVGEPAER